MPGGSQTKRFANDLLRIYRRALHIRTTGCAPRKRFNLLRLKRTESAHALRDSGAAPEGPRRNMLCMVRIKR